MILAKTNAGEVWHDLLNADCLSSVNTMSQLVDVSEQLKQLDENEAVYLSKDGQPVMRVSDLLDTINKRVARYQSLAVLSGAA